MGIYAIYFTWNDGTEDTDIIVGASLRNKVINNLLDRVDEDGKKTFIKISYCRIYKGGYGKRIMMRGERI